MSSGCFISLEGGEGSGKSTQIKRLKTAIEHAGKQVIVTREPGGTPIAEALRNIILTGDPDSMDAKTEALILFAARRNHVEKLIKPALSAGTWVISDRFADSSRAYQGIAGGLGLDTIEELYRWTLGNFAPDLTLILDIDVKTGLARAGKRMANDDQAEDRFERFGIDFHETMRQAFHTIQLNEPQRVKLINADQSMDMVAKSIWQTVQNHFNL